MSDNAPPVSFQSPPIAEVALSLQFEPLVRLHIAHLGLLWERFRSRFPRTEEHPALPHVIEEFDVPRRAAPGIRIEVTGVPAVPRCWFLNAAGTELIQVQQDRFTVNWRRGDGDEPYPEYNHVRAFFTDAFDTFRAFLLDTDLGAVQADQCEVTYVDHIERRGVWERHGQLEKVLRVWKSLDDVGLLTEPEAVSLNMRFLTWGETMRGKRGDSKTPLGRLHIELQPGFRRADAKPILVMNSVARGAPLDDSINGALAFFDMAHLWIRQGFLDLTSPEMQAVWRSPQDG